MKGEDIDKLFRDKLGGAVEPTNEEDWKAFEASLDRKGGFINPKIIALTLLLLVGGGILTYFLGGFSALNSEPITKVELKSDKANSSKNNSSKESVSAKRTSETNGIAKEPSVQKSQLESKSLDDHSVAATRESSQTKNSRSNESRIETNGNQKLVSTISDNKTSSQPNNNTSYSMGSTLATSKANQLKTENIEENRLGDSNSEQKSKGLESSKRIDIENSMSLGGTGTPDKAIANQKDSGKNQEGVNYDLAFLEPLSGIVSLDYDPQFLIDAKQFKKLEAKQRFGAFIYLKAEHNLLLRNGFGGGLGLNLSIGNPSNWTRNLSLSGGIGFQRTGTMAWRQTGNEVIYGFDKYSSEYELITERLDLIQVPIYLNYSFAGLHQVFLGIESSFVLGSLQTLSSSSPFDDIETNQSGNLFATNSPKSIFFLHFGYSYFLNERYKLQIGGSYSNQSWETTQNTPLGVFLKLNYQIR